MADSRTTYQSYASDVHPGRPGYDIVGWFARSRNLTQPAHSLQWKHHLRQLISFLISCSFSLLMLTTQTRSFQLSWFLFYALCPLCPDRLTPVRFWWPSIRTRFYPSTRPSRSNCTENGKSVNYRRTSSPLATTVTAKWNVIAKISASLSGEKLIIIIVKKPTPVRLRSLGITQIGNFSLKIPQWFGDFCHHRHQTYSTSVSSCVLCNRKM